MLLNYIKVAALTGALSVISACGSGGSDEAEVPSVSSLDSVFNSRMIQNSACPNGGIEIQLGIDANGNGRLDLVEIDDSRTQIVCHGTNGSDGVDGVDGASVDLSELTIESIVEVAGSNCLHGGTKHQIGIDSNASGKLDESEVISTSFSCEINSPPTIHFTRDGNVIAGSDYALDILGQDQYGDNVKISLVSAPAWLTEVQLADDQIQLTGTAPSEVGASFVIQVSATDGELASASSLTLNTIDGIQVSATAENIIEGNAGSKEGVFHVELSSPVTNILQVHYQLRSSTSQQNIGWETDTPSGVLVFNTGETAKQVVINILSDTNYELGEEVYFTIQKVDYAGQEYIQAVNSSTLKIINDDQLIMYADQENSVPVYTNIYGSVDFFALNNQPSWMAIEPAWNIGSQMVLTGTPNVESIGTQGTFDLYLAEIDGYNNGLTKKHRIEYSILEGDKDADGVPNSQDVFPENSAAQTDSDNDGLGDEWELAQFESLDLAGATTDFDNNGITDLVAFQKNSPVNAISFSFESGTLPENWINTGDVDWVVSSEKSYHGDYSLTLAQPLEPGQTASVHFEVITQVGSFIICFTRKYTLSSWSLPDFCRWF